jgi:hypothetical protein
VCGGSTGGLADFVAIYSNQFDLTSTVAAPQADLDTVAVKDTCKPVPTNEISLAHLLVARRLGRRVRGQSCGGYFEGTRELLIQTPPDVS